MKYKHVNEPLCLVEEDLHQFADAKYFPELDLSRTYYRIKLSENAHQYTAFPTAVEWVVD